MPQHTLRAQRRPQSLRTPPKKLTDRGYWYVSVRRDRTPGSSVRDLTSIVPVAFRVDWWSIEVILILMLSTSSFKRIKGGLGRPDRLILSVCWMNWRSHRINCSSWFITCFIAFPGVRGVSHSFPSVISQVSRVHFPIRSEVSGELTKCGLDLVCQKARLMAHDPSRTSAPSVSSAGESGARRSAGETDVRQVQRILSKNEEMQDVVSR